MDDLDQLRAQHDELIRAHAVALRRIRFLEFRIHRASHLLREATAWAHDGGGTPSDTSLRQMLRLRSDE